MTPDLTEMQLLSRLAVALAIGLLVGLERGWQSREEQKRRRAAGFRTFALSGLLGGIAGAITLHTNGAVLGLLFIGYAGAFTAFHWLEARATGDLSVTSIVAGLLTFALGAYALFGPLVVAVAAAVAATLLLALREPLHRWVESLRWEEIRAMLTLLAMSFLLLPILPNRSIDPWQAVNPFEIWLLAIMIAAISFGGYVAVRLFGDRLGLVVAALAGGLASSTATALTLARLARVHPASVRLLAAGILLASSVMVVRVGMVAVVLNPVMAGPLVWPLGAGLAALLLAALVLLRRTQETERAALTIANPLEVGMAVKMAAFITAVLLATHWVQGVVGDAGTLALAAASGLADVDAVTVSMARMGGQGVGLNVAAGAIALAVSVNTLVKTGLAISVGGWALGRPVALANLLALAAGGAAAWFFA